MFIFPFILSAAFLTMLSPSPRAVVALASCLVDTVEAFEDSRLLLAGNFYSVVFDGDGDGIGGDCAARHDIAICGRILETWCGRFMMSLHLLFMRDHLSFANRNLSA